MKKYLADLNAAVEGTVCTAAPFGAEWNLGQAVINVASAIMSHRVFVIGNGGSAAIASHVAIDLMRAGIAAMTLSDIAAMTCLTNDHGYERVFSDQISLHGAKDNVLIAISSSGKSKNILRCCDVAKFFKKMKVITFSGFDVINELRRLGDINFWTPSKAYGHIELAHQTILHAITDMVGLMMIDAAGMGSQYVSEMTGFNALEERL
jgi:D-sedoheptulose 7-phosphate isomerase